MGKHREAAAQTSKFKHMRATHWTNLEVLIARLTLFYSETIVDVQRKRFLNFVTTHVNLGFRNADLGLGCWNPHSEICNLQSIEWLANHGAQQTQPGSEATGLLLATFQTLPTGLIARFFSQVTSTHLAPSFP